MAMACLLASQLGWLAAWLAWMAGKAFSIHYCATLSTTVMYYTTPYRTTVPSLSSTVFLSFVSPKQAYS